MKRYYTDIEDLMLKELEKRGLIKGVDFATQFPIRNSFILDFAFPDQKIAIECDGEPWHTSPKARKRDGFKNYILKKRGWKVLRFWGSEIRSDVTKCVDKIMELVNA